MAWPTYVVWILSMPMNIFQTLNNAMAVGTVAALISDV
jgi:hypothetical protein